MRVCGMCRTKSIEKLTTVALLTIQEYEIRDCEWILIGDYELTCEKEICTNCCGKLLKLFEGKKKRVRKRKTNTESFYSICTKLGGVNWEIFERKERGKR